MNEIITFSISWSLVPMFDCWVCVHFNFFWLSFEPFNSLFLLFVIIYYGYYGHIYWIMMRVFFGTFDTYFDTIWYYFILFDTIWYYIILFYTYYIIWYYMILFYTILYLFDTVWYYLIQLFFFLIKLFLIRLLDIQT